MRPHILISGASIAGPALALRLNASGWRTTVVERAPELREEGQNVDVRGAAREVARRMDIENAILAGSTGEVGLRFVDDRGAELAAFPAGQNDTDGGTAEAEILRGRLARILFDRTREETDYRFGETIDDVQETGHGVTATLSGGESIEADLLVVAEGTRSRTRDRLFDDVEVDELGLGVAYLPIPRAPGDDRWWSVHNATGSRAVGLRPDDVGTTRASLTFLSPVRGLEDLDRAAQVAILRRTFDDVGWQSPRVLAALDDAPFYFDAVAQVRARTWSRGRVVLLGDAAWSPGPFGTGTSLALVGAYVLAGELATSSRVAQALRGYEALMRPFAAKAQDVRPATIRAMNPSTAAGLVVQRAALRLAATASAGPLDRVVQRLTRPPSRAIELPSYPAPAGVPAR